VRVPNIRACPSVIGAAMSDADSTEPSRTTATWSSVWSVTFPSGGTPAGAYLRCSSVVSAAKADVPGRSNLRATCHW
jgi:hypothetical protein